jgi:hypothetical protein
VGKQLVTLTESGEAMRAAAERVLRSRYATLRERGERRELTPVEQNELAGLGAALHELLELEAPRLSDPPAG